MAFILFVACAITGILKLKELIQPPDAVFTGPGEYHFHVPVADEYTIWQRIVGVTDNEFRVTKSALPEGARIRVDHAGHSIAITGDTSLSSSTTGIERRSVLRFVAVESGEFVVTTSGFDDKLSFEISHGPIFIPLLMVMGSFGSAAVLIILAIILVVLAIAGIFPKRPKRPPLLTQSCVPARQMRDI